MSLITENYLKRHVTLPVSLPSTQLDRNTWIVACAFKLQGDMTAQYLWATLNVLNVGVPPHTIVAPPGLVTLGLYRNFDNGLHPREQMAIETVAYVGDEASSGSLLMVRAPLTPSQSEIGTINSKGARYFIANPVTLTEGNYSIVLANNSSDHDYILALTGAVKLNIG